MVALCLLARAGVEQGRYIVFDDNSFGLNLLLRWYIVSASKILNNGVPVTSYKKGSVIYGIVFVQKTINQSG